MDFDLTSCFKAGQVQQTLPVFCDPSLIPIQPCDNGVVVQRTVAVRTFLVKMEKNTGSCENRDEGPASCGSHTTLAVNKIWRGPVVSKDFSSPSPQEP